MATEDANNTNVSKQQTSNIESNETGELADDALESVTGGLASTGGTTLSSNDTSVCISAV